MVKKVYKLKASLLNVSYTLGGTRVHVMDSHMERQNMCMVTCCLFHLERENWKSDIASKPKLRSYIKLKADYGET